MAPVGVLYAKDVQSAKIVDGDIPKSSWHIFAALCEGGPLSETAGR